MWSIVNFGKFSEKKLTLPQIVLRDPDWFFWALENDAFQRGLGAQGKDIGRKATRIKIKKPDPSNWKVEYMFAPGGEFSHFDIVPEDRPHHLGSSVAMYAPHLDLSFVRRFKKYDKLGGKLLIKSFKAHWFGKSSTRLTKERCENFFEDSSNFI